MNGWRAKFSYPTRFVVVLLMGLVSQPILAEEVLPKDQAEWVYTDIDGERHAPFSEKSVQFLVVIFVSTDCPIANYYQPTIKRLAKNYQSKGVRFLLFHTDPFVSSEKRKEHAREYQISSPVFFDADFTLAKRLKAGTTPEAFVVSRKGVTRYRGRIDDTYVAWGKKRRNPVSKDLQNALNAVLEGMPVASPVTKPIGCYIPLELAKKDRASAE